LFILVSHICAINAGGAFFSLDTIFTNSIAHLRNAIGREISYPVDASAAPELLSTSLMKFSDANNGFVLEAMKAFASGYSLEAGLPMWYGDEALTQASTRHTAILILDPINLVFFFVFLFLFIVFRCGIGHTMNLTIFVKSL
jgi:hypothetical protein